MIIIIMKLSNNQFKMFASKEVITAAFIDGEVSLILEIRVLIGSLRMLNVLCAFILIYFIYRLYF